MSQTKVSQESFKSSLMSWIGVVLGKEKNTNWIYISMGFEGCIHVISAVYVFLFLDELYLYLL